MCESRKIQRGKEQEHQECCFLFFWELARIYYVDNGCNYGIFDFDMYYSCATHNPRQYVGGIGWRNPRELLQCFYVIFKFFNHPKTKQKK